MEIFEIKLKSKNNPNIFIVSTDEGNFEFHSDMIVKAGIKIGEYDDKIFYESKKESDEIVAFNLSVKYVGAKIKTEKQIKDYLLKKEFDFSIVKKVVEKLKNYGIVNDNIFAESYVKSNQNFSKNKLKQKLFSFGVGGENVEQAVEEIDDFVSCLKHAEKFLKNKTIEKSVLDKLIRRLSSMGYGWGTIKKVLNELKMEVED